MYYHIVMKRTKSRAKRQSEISVNKRRALVRAKAISGITPVTVSACIEFKICYQKQLDQHIGGVFPLILQLVHDGHSIREIELMCGIREGLIKRFLHSNPSLNRYVIAARSLKTDSNSNMLQ